MTFLMEMVADQFAKKTKKGGTEMSKGDRKRGNREAKKPKKLKEKVVATADFTKGKVLTWTCPGIVPLL